MGKHQIRINTQNMDPGQSRNNVLFDLRGIRGDSGGGGQVYHNVKSISLKHMEIPTGGYIIDNYNNCLPLVYGEESSEHEQDTILLPSESAAKFGECAAISGDTIVVGADEAEAFAGAAYVFIYTAGSWIQQAKLTVAGGGQFGSAVAIDGDTIVVGAYHDGAGGANAGAAYVFTRGAV